MNSGTEPTQQQLSDLKEHLKRARFKEAEKIATSITKDFPNNQFAWKALWAALQKNGKIKESLSAIQKSIQLSPQDPKEHYTLGITLQKLERLKEAQACFAKAIVLKPDYYQAHYRLGITYEKFEKVREAEISHRKVTEYKTDHHLAHYHLGRLLQEQGRSIDAEASFKKVIALKPGLPVPHNDLGVTLQELGRLEEAEKSFKRAINLKPDFAEAHNNLGNLLKELGKFKESEESYLKALQLKPGSAQLYNNYGITLKAQGNLNEAEKTIKKALELDSSYPEAHFNLGIVLHESGKIKEAEASYARAVKFKPNYSEAYNNFGIILTELGRLDEAEEKLNKAIDSRPNYPEALSNLGDILRKLKRFNASEASFNQAILLKPNYSDAYNNFGIMLTEVGRLDKAEEKFNKALSLNPKFASALFNLSIVQSCVNNTKAQIESLKTLIQYDSDNYGLRASVHLAIYKFLENNFERSKAYLSRSTKILEKKSPEFTTEKVYWGYLSDILKWHEENNQLTRQKRNKTLYAVGDSHSLVSHQIKLECSNIVLEGKAILIMGCKQWHLGNSFRNKYKCQFETIFFALPKHSYVLVAIGEIDCRLDTGIIAHKRKFPEKQIKEIISDTIEDYLNYIVNTNSDYQHNIIIQGVPCPNLDVRNYSARDIRELCEVIKIFNYELNMQSKKKGFGFLDTYQLTNKGNGLSNGYWHIDNYHLSPEGMQEAWRNYVS